MISTLVLLLTTVVAVQGAIEADKVTSLPGFNGPLPSTHYSGCKLNVLFFFRMAC